LFVAKIGVKMEDGRWKVKDVPNASLQEKMGYI